MNNRNEADKNTKTGTWKLVRCRRGFTTLELFIVCMIIAILASMSVPAFLRYTANSNLKSATREVASDIFNMKAKAISENRRQRIVFTVANETYTLEERNAADTAWVNLLSRDVKHFGGNINITNTTFGSDAITFQTRGTATIGSAVLTNQRGSTATITVSITGRTHVAYSLQ